MAGTGRSVMQHQFSQSPQAKIERSSFDRSHGLKTTFNETDLVPIYVDEVLPGDTFTMQSNLFGRLATPIYPVMDNMYLDVFYFFIPYRLVWTHFVNFFGEQANPTDSTSFLVPTVVVAPGNSGAANLVGGPLNTLADMMGIAVSSAYAGNFAVNSLPFRAYNLVWNQWFRDENLQNSVNVNMGDGPDVTTDYNVLPRGKRKDYFTSCLPWPQKGPAVTIPLGGASWVRAAGGDAPYVDTNIMRMRRSDTGAYLGTAATLGVTSASGNVDSWAAPSGVVTGMQPSNLYADLGSGATATINQLRQAFQIQKIYERDARGGTRYTELIKSHFGVTSPDARLQRTEYLGGGSCPLNVNPIAQTGATGASGTTTPQGHLAGMGTVHSHGIGFSKSFTEHGVLLGLVNFRADINYQDGNERMWTRSTRFDFYWPALAHIGEQAVLNQEIYTQSNANDTLVFGYQERYAEYRYKPSRVCGAFRSTSATPLDAWHLSQHFSALPVLNAAFIVDKPPVSRIVAVPSEPRILLDVYHRLRCARPMPVYGIPGLVDHF